MKRLICCLAASALSALSQTGGGFSAPLSIYTDFQNRPSPAVEGSIQKELALLVSPIGLQLAWKSLSAPRDYQSSAALVVLKFKGRCDAAGLESHGVLPGALAWTHITDGVILPFVDVDCDSARGFLQSKLIRIDGRIREQLFGRAVARLVGHELYHVFADTRHHGSDGVARPACTAGELLSDDFGFAEKQLRTLRSTKLKTILTFGRVSGGQAEYRANGCATCHGPQGQGTKLAPVLAAKGKPFNPKALLTHFDRKSEEMYRRARTHQLDWYFPTDDEIRDIVAALAAGLE